VSCRRVLWPMICGLLVVQTLSGCNHGEEGNPLWTEADDINDAGDIVGLFRLEAGEEAIQGFLRKADGTILRFSLPGFEQARFSDINNLGVISGFGIDAEGLFHAVVLTPITPAPNTFFEDTE
jgi:hypothetical protein